VSRGWPAGGGRIRWQAWRVAPGSVTWSPDGTTLVFHHDTLRWQLELDAESTWRHLVDLDTWSDGLGSPSEGSLHPGVQLIVNHGDGYLCTSEVESVESGRSLVTSWSFPDEHRSWLELTVSRTGEGGSVVVLNHHELGALSEFVLARVARPPHVLRGIRN
jgi:hypothetical protein